MPRCDTETLVARVLDHAVPAHGRDPRIPLVRTRDSLPRDRKPKRDGTIAPLGESETLFDNLERTRLAFERAREALNSYLEKHNCGEG